MNKIAVIGAGPMGLMCAYELLKNGKLVDLYEADDRIGGMSAHFNFNGLSIERYYHFICKPDIDMLKLLQELNLSNELKWRKTSMGYFYHGKLYKWGDPISLLRFSPLNLISRLRYGVHMFYCTKIQKWDRLNNIDAITWIKKWSGRKGYQILWDRLFKLKFHHFADNLSAAWIWARIRRVGRSRRNILHEELGYLEGGSETLLNELYNRITHMGGKIFLRSHVTAIKSSQVTDGLVITTKEGEQCYSTVISTIPLPFVPRMFNDLPEDTISRYRAINNIGVVCVIFKLKKPISEHFWVNISDPDIEIPGIIEYSNLRSLPYSVVYVPFYLPQSADKYKRNDSDFISESLACFIKINSNFCETDVIDVHVSRYGFAQPICEPGFDKKLPPIKTTIPGLFIADTSHYYPEDRSISESVKLGSIITKMI